MGLVCNFLILLSNLSLSLSKFSLLVSLFLNLFLVEENCLEQTWFCVCVCLCVQLMSRPVKIFAVNSEQ